MGDRNSKKQVKQLGASEKSSDPVPNHSTDRILQQKQKFLESLDKKIGSANILAISMLSEIRKRSLKERDLFIYNTKVPWSKRKDLKELLPSPSGQDVKKGRKKKGVKKFSPSPHDDERDKCQRKRQRWELLPQDESLEVGRKDFAKMYIKTNGNRRIGAMALLDSGADLSLMTLQYLKTLCSDDEVRELLSKGQSDIKPLTSYSNNQLNVVGRICVKGRFTEQEDVGWVDLYIQIIDSDDVFYPFLVGNDIVRRLLLQIRHERDKKNILRSSVMAGYPTKYEFPVYIETVERLDEIVVNVNLKPRQGKLIEYKIREPHRLNIGDQVVITCIDESRISSIPSLNIVTKNWKFFISVYNPTNKAINQLVPFVCEVIPPDYEINSRKPPGRCSVVRVNQTKDRGDFEFRGEIPDMDDRVRPLNAFLINNKSLQNEQTENEQSPLLAPLPGKNPDLNAIDLGSLPEEKEEYDGPKIMKDQYGYEITGKLTPEEVVELDKFPEHVRPHVKRIFIEKYPDVLSLSPTDYGNLSDTLGAYTIKLKEGQKVPTFKRIYYLSPTERQHMSDLISYLIKYGIVERVDSRKKDENFNSAFISPSFIVPKKDLSGPARLVINYSLINSMISSRLPTLPDINAILHGLRGKALFSSFDFSNAFYSVKITEESKPYTRFAGDHGYVDFLRLPMGMVFSPASFDEYAQKVVHYTADRDKDGNLIRDKNGVVSMSHNPLESSHVFYDDILCSSDLKETSEKTIEEHFRQVEKLVERLSFHQAKINFAKSQIGVSRIMYLGWNVSYNHLVPDKSRITRLLESEMPQSKKGLRAYLGLINTLRSCLNHNFIKQMSVLTPLTSATREYKIEPKHVEAFEEVKKLLTTSDIFSNIIGLYNKKILFTDASDESFAGVLCQISETRQGDPYIPPHLALGNPVHQLIFDLKFEYIPVPLYMLKEKVSRTEFKRAPIEKFELANYHELPYCGYKKEDCDESLFHAIRSIEYAYNCNLSEIDSLREKLVKYLRASIIGLQVKTFSFNDNTAEYKSWLENLKKGKCGLDPNLYCLEGLPKILRRKCIFISSFPLHNGEKVLQTGLEYFTPSFIFGVYRRDGKTIFTPYFEDKDAGYDLNKLEKRLEICSYFGRTIPEAEKKLSIFEKEVQGLTHSLDHFRKLIGHSPLTVLVDNKAMYLAMSPKIQHMYPKVYRWALKIHTQFPQIEMQFVKGNRNISDWLTRSYAVRPKDLVRIPLKEISVSSKIDELIDFDKTYTLSEFREFCEDNDDLIVPAIGQKPQTTVCSIKYLQKSHAKFHAPLIPLKQKLEHENIRKEQRIEFDDIYQDCLNAPDFTFKDKNVTYKLVNGLILRSEDEGPKILLPTSLIGMICSYIHLAYTHAGETKMKSLLDTYYFKNKYTHIRKICSSCYGCFMNNPNSGQDYIGGYPVPRYALEVVHGDYMQSLPGNYGHFHVLVMSCPLSGILMTFPVKNLTSEVAVGIMSRFIFPYFTVKTFVSDAGTVFTSDHFRDAMKLFNIQKIEIARLAPAHNGPAEKAIHLFKTALRKYTTKESQQSWYGLVPFLTRIHNTTPRNKTGMTPLSLLFGNHEHAKSPFDLELWPDNKVFMNDAQDLEKMNLERERLVRIARERLIEVNAELKKDRNKNTVKREYKPGDIVFTRNRKYTQGVSPALKTKWSPDPFVVLRGLSSSAVIMRIADGSRFYYRNYDIKRPNAFATEELDIPNEVKPYLSIPVAKYKDRAYALIRKHAVFDFPYNAIDINKPEEIEAAIQKHTRIDPRDRNLTNPLEHEYNEELVEDPPNDTDGQIPSDTPEIGSERNEPFTEVDEEENWDNTETISKLGSRDKNHLPPADIVDLEDGRDEQLPDPDQDDREEDNESPNRKTESSNNNADKTAHRTMNHNFQADGTEKTDPPKRPMSAKKRKKRKRQTKGRPTKKLEIMKADTPKQPQREQPAKAPYKLRSRPQEGDSSEDEEEVKGKKQVSFEDEEPQSKKPLRVEIGEPIAEIQDMI